MTITGRLRPTVLAILPLPRRFLALHERQAWTQLKHRKPINASEAAEYLGISVSTLSKRRVFGGGPKYLKLGRRVVYDPRDLDAWLNAHRRASTSDPGAQASGR